MKTRWRASLWGCACERRCCIGPWPGRGRRAGRMREGVDGGDLSFSQLGRASWLQRHRQDPQLPTPFTGGVRHESADAHAPQLNTRAQRQLPARRPLPPRPAPPARPLPTRNPPPDAPQKNNSTALQQRLHPPQPATRVCRPPTPLQHAPPPPPPAPARTHARGQRSARSARTHTPGTPCCRPPAAPWRPPGCWRASPHPQMQRAACPRSTPEPPSTTTHHHANNTGRRKREGQVR